MEIHFIKMQGAGNDYIYLDGLEKSIPPIAVASLCDRHYGVGGDGVVIILPYAKGDAFMRMFNLDGSEGNMCGNAIRCVGRYLHEKTGKKQFVIGTKSGDKRLRIEGDKVVADMGIPRFLRREKGADFILVGNPHAVLYGKKNLKKGSRLQKKYDVNVEFYTPEIVEVYERGSGETLSCGTGACAVAVSLVQRGIRKRGEWISIPMRGGILEVFWGERIFLRGEGKKVFEGRVVL